METINTVLGEIEESTGIDFQALDDPYLPKLLETADPVDAFIKSYKKSLFILWLLNTLIVALWTYFTRSDYQMLLGFHTFIINFFIAWGLAFLLGLGQLLRTSINLLERICYYFTESRPKIFSKYVNKLEDGVLYQDFVIGVLLGFVWPILSTKTFRHIWLLGSLINSILRYIVYRSAVFIKTEHLFLEPGLGVELGSDQALQISPDQEVAIKRYSEKTRFILILVQFLIYLNLCVYLVFNLHSVYKSYYLY